MDKIETENETGTGSPFEASMFYKLGIIGGQLYSIMGKRSAEIQKGVLKKLDDIIDNLNNQKNEN